MKIKTTEKTSYHSPEKKPQGIQDSTLPNFLGVSKLLQSNKRMGETKVWIMFSVLELCVLEINAYIVG